MALMTGPVSPYITPDQLTTYPLGVSWNTIPDQRASDAAKYAAQVLICQTATGMADARCNQVLRSTSQTETLHGPGGYRFSMLPDGTSRLLLSQWPILGVTAMQVARSVPLPYQFTPVTTGNWAVERPALLVTSSSVAADSGTGGQAVILGPGYVQGGRGAYVAETTYLAGWPHCGITVAANPGDEILQVDDCTGWAPASPGAPGATGVIQDTSVAQQEAIACAASSVTVGPGFLSLAAPLQYAHDPGILATALPGQIQWATALFAASQALTRGSTSTTIQTTRGGAQRNAGGGAALAEMACQLLAPFRRTE
jgi:hypothetical protein